MVSAPCLLRFRCASELARDSRWGLTSCCRVSQSQLQILQIIWDKAFQDSKLRLRWVYRLDRDRCLLCILITEPVLYIACSFKRKQEMEACWTGNVMPIPDTLRFFFQLSNAVRVGEFFMRENVPRSDRSSSRRLWYRLTTAKREKANLRVLMGL